MNVDSLLKQAKKRINPLDSELILLNILGEKDRSFFAVHEDQVLSSEQLKKFEEMVEKREKGVPLAYILGIKEFYGRNFSVSPEVLIPRPESEAIIDFAKELSVKKIIDVGTGSGCLGISLKLEIPEAKVLATDISEDALKIARENAENLGTDVEFLVSNLLESVEEKFDLIVANLPYVSRDWDWTSGIEFEPEIALFAEDNGLFLIKKLVEQAEGRTKYLILESDTSQQEEIVDFAKNYGFRFIKKDNFVTVFSA